MLVCLIVILLSTVSFGFLACLFALFVHFVRLLSCRFTRTVKNKGFHSLPGVFASAPGADVPLAGPLGDGGSVCLRRGRDYSARVRCAAAGENSRGLRPRPWNGKNHSDTPTHY